MLSCICPAISTACYPTRQQRGAYKQSLLNHVTDSHLTYEPSDQWMPDVKSLNRYRQFGIANSTSTSIVTKDAEKYPHRQIASDELKMHQRLHDITLGLSSLEGPQAHCQFVPSSTLLLRSGSLLDFRQRAWLPCSQPTARSLEFVELFLSSAFFAILHGIGVLTTFASSSLTPPFPPTISPSLFFLISYQKSFRSPPHSPVANSKSASLKQLDTEQRKPTFDKLPLQPRQPLIPNPHLLNLNHLIAHNGHLLNRPPIQITPEALGNLLLNHSAELRHSGTDRGGRLCVVEGLSEGGDRVGGVDLSARLWVGRGA